MAKRIGKYKVSKREHAIYKHDVDTFTGSVLDIDGTANVGGLLHAEANLKVTGNSHFNNGTPIALQAGAAQAATDVGSISNFPANGAAAVSDATDLEAACDAIRALEVLLNEIRACLVDSGLIKGAA